MPVHFANTHLSVSRTFQLACPRLRLLARVYAYIYYDRADVVTCPCRPLSFSARLCQPYDHIDLRIQLDSPLPSSFACLSSLLPTAGY